MCRLGPGSSDEEPLHVTSDTPPQLMPLSAFDDLDPPSQWHIVTAIVTYMQAFNSRTDREAQKRQLVNPYPWFNWMGDDDVRFMLHARSNQKAWSLFQTRGSDGQKVAYEKWLGKFNANPMLDKLKPGMKEHVMGAKYVRHVKLTPRIARIRLILHVYQVVFLEILKEMKEVRS